VYYKFSVPTVNIGMQPKSHDYKCKATKPLQNHNIKTNIKLKCELHFVYKHTCYNLG